MSIPAVLKNLTLKQVINKVRAKKHKSMLRSTIDESGFFEIRKRARDLSPSLMDMKYFDLDYWLEDALFRNFNLGIDHMRQKRILDIGTGFGFFPYTCEYFGNIPCAIDRPGHKLYDEVTDFLRIEKKHHWVTAFEPLPTFDQKFDLITAYQIAFDRTDASAWGAKEWEYLINDILENLLEKGGQLHLELNYRFDLGAFYDSAIQKVYLDHGATLRRERVSIVKR